MSDEHEYKHWCVELVCAYLKEKGTGNVITDVTATVVNPIKEFIVKGEDDAEIR